MRTNKCEIYIYGESQSLQEFESIANNEHKYGLNIIGNLDIDYFSKLTESDSLVLDAEVNGNIISTLFFEKQEPLNKILLENPIEKDGNLVSLDSHKRLLDSINSKRDSIVNKNHNEKAFIKLIFDKRIDLIMASLMFNLRIEIENKDYYDCVERKIILENGLVLENSFESIFPEEDSIEEEEETLGMPIMFMD